MTNDPREWWEIKRDSCEDAESLYYLVPIVCEESRSRFKEEVVKALEGMKKCRPGTWGDNECAACREGFKEDCTAKTLQDAIETIKKL